MLLYSSVCSLRVQVYASTERCVPSALLLASRPEPAPADCCSLATEGRAARASGSKQRRDTAVSPSNSSIVLLLFAVVDNILNLESMPFFYLNILMTQTVGFWPTTRRLWVIGFSKRKNSDRISHILDCINRVIHV